MSDKQFTIPSKAFIIFTCGLFLLILLFPPWHKEAMTSNDIEFGFLLAPPFGASGISLSTMLIESLAFLMIAGCIYFFPAWRLEEERQEESHDPQANPPPLTKEL